MSIGMGLAIPLFYLVLLILTFGGLRYFGVGYRHWFEYFTLPISWPADIYAHFFGYKGGLGQNALKGDVWIAGIIGDVLLYTFFVYSFLRIRDAHKLEQEN